MASQELVAYEKQLDIYKDNFAKVLPAHMPVDKLMRMAYSAAAINTNLLSCERGSLFRSVLTGAILGLEIDGVTGQAFLVPFKGKVQLIVGYKGYITLAFNSGYILEGQVVREFDDFQWNYGLTPHLFHAPKNPLATNKDRGTVMASYSVARHKDHNLSTFRVCPMDKIIEARDCSQAYQYAKSKGSDTPWITRFDEQAKKTAIRHHADELPLNVQRAVAMEQKHDETGEPVHLTSQGVPIAASEKYEDPLGDDF